MKIGDIVSSNKRWLPVPANDGIMFGIIVADNGDSLGVEFHGLTAGHNCAGKANNRQGWFCQRCNLTVVESREVEEEEVEIGF